MIGNFRAASALGALAISLGTATIASAQDEPKAADGGALEEIIVTAERRETSVQDTPASIIAMSGDALRDAASGAAAHYFLCGPDDFNDSLRRQLVALGVPSQAIVSELFTTLARESRPHPKDPHPVMFQVGGSQMEVTVRPGETLLEAGLRAGVALPFSCTMGGCGHCKVKVVNGDVATDAPNCLTEPERQAGYALACCAYPHRHATVTVEEKA